MDIEQAQHGYGVQSCDLEQAEKLRGQILFLRRLQLGLESSTHCARLYTAQQRVGRHTLRAIWTHSDDDESAEGLSHWGMVSALASMNKYLANFNCFLIFQRSSSQEKQLRVYSSYCQGSERS